MPDPTVAPPLSKREVWEFEQSVKLLHPGLTYHRPWDDPRRLLATIAAREAEIEALRTELDRIYDDSQDVLD